MKTEDDLEFIGELYIEDVDLLAVVIDNEEYGIEILNKTKDDD